MAYTDEYRVQYSDDKRKLIKFDANLFSNDMVEYFVYDGTEVIGATAFKGNNSLRVIHLPDSIRLVENEAFSGCKIEEVHFAGGIEQWLQINWKGTFNTGYRLYFNDTNLVESVIIPENISVIKECAFYYCKSLQSVIFNKSITLIERDAFNKSGLKGILSIPKSCLTIKQFAFFNCSGITKVKIPNTTQSIWHGAFSACYGLQRFVVSSGNENFYTDGVGLYSYLKVPYSNAIYKSKLNLVALASGSNVNYCIHNNTISIVSEACCLGSIPGEKLEITHSVDIAKGAFRSCKDSITIKAPIAMKKALLRERVSLNRIEPTFDYQDALISHEPPEVVSLNPFRVLGVYCDASAREIQSNVARIKRFLEIGKQPKFIADFNEVLPPLQRTQEMVDKALSQISQPKEKLAYAFLWFSKPCCEQHHKAEYLLRNSKIEEARELILRHREDSKTMIGPYICLSHQHSNSESNLIWLASIVHSFYFENKITDNNGQSLNSGKSLIADICGDNFYISEEECQILLFDKLITFVNPIHLWACSNSGCFSETVIQHLFSQSIGKNIAKINSQITSTNAINKNESAKQLQAAQNLIRNTKNDINIIDDYLPLSDVRAISVHDALSDKVLQLAINIYNHADDINIVARDVLALMQDALTLAYGDIVKNRCLDNIRVVKETVDELPPIGLEVVDTQIYKAVMRARNSADTISEAIKLLKEVEPLLYEVNLNLISEVDSDAAKQAQNYFTKVSTAIANICLNKLIEDVNNSRGEKSFEAWQIITALNQLPLSDEFKKNRYDKNCGTLLRNINNSVIYAFPSTSDKITYDILDIRPEAVVWAQCQKDNTYKHYIRRFPNGAHITEARLRQNAITARAQEQARQKREQARQEREQARQEHERARQEQERERVQEDKTAREGKILNWTIGILIFTIALELAYLFWEWNGVIAALGIIAIGIAVYVGLLVLYYTQIPNS